MPASNAFVIAQIVNQIVADHLAACRKRLEAARLNLIRGGKMVFARRQRRPQQPGNHLPLRNALTAGHFLGGIEQVIVDIECSTHKFIIMMLTHHDDSMVE